MVKPSAKVEMLIRKPVAEVFEAFINPDVTSKFWFSRGSGRLEAGRTVVWSWDMYDFSVDVDVKAVEPNRRIFIEWPGSVGTTTVKWVFKPLGEDATFVSITNEGFQGDDDAVVQEAIGSTEGFAFVLAGAKAYLEHGIALNLVPDRFPQGLENS